MWVKVCGVTEVQQARQLEALGVNALGINLYPPSPRSVSADQAAALVASVQVTTVLVVVDRPHQELQRLIAHIKPDLVQLHGHEPQGYELGLGAPTLRAWRAAPGVLRELRDQAAPRFLLDAYVQGEPGGTGRQVDLDLAAQAARLGQMVLAGGLTPDNVAHAVRRVRPWGVDVASGVERAPGDKDPDKVRAFLQAARSALGTPAL